MHNSECISGLPNVNEQDAFVFIFIPNLKNTFSLVVGVWNSVHCT